MKKILALLFVLTILGSTVLGSQASAVFDEMPPVMKKSITIPIEQFNHLDY